MIPSPWGSTHAQDPGEGSVSRTEAMQSRRRGKEERQERVSCSETPRRDGVRAPCTRSHSCEDNRCSGQRILEISAAVKENTETAVSHQAAGEAGIRRVGTATPLGCSFCGKDTVKSKAENTMTCTPISTIQCKHIPTSQKRPAHNSRTSAQLRPCAVENQSHPFTTSQHFSVSFAHQWKMSQFHSAR